MLTLNNLVQTKLVCGDLLDHCASICAFFNFGFQGVFETETVSRNTPVLNVFVVCGPFQRLSTLVAPCPSIRFCNITAALFSKGLCSWPLQNRSVAPKGGRGPRLRSPALNPPFATTTKTLR